MIILYWEWSDWEKHLASRWMGTFFIWPQKFYTHTQTYSLKSTEDDDDGGEETANINSHFVERQVWKKTSTNYIIHSL